jgi:hypothetical protein
VQLTDEELAASSRENLRPSEQSVGDLT